MNHSDLVRNLTKPGDEIVRDITAAKAHMLHMIMGISGEVGELLDAVKKSVIYNKPLDIENTIEELGDIEFYLEGFRQGLTIDRDYVLQCNIDKLQKRYSSGSYSDNQAKERADKVELKKLTPDEIDMIDSQQCDHDWNLTWKHLDESNQYYKCHKCNAVKGSL